MSDRRLIVLVLGLAVCALPTVQVCAGLSEMSEDCPMMTPAPPELPPCHQSADRMVEGTEHGLPDCCVVSAPSGTQDGSRTLAPRLLSPEPIRAGAVATFSGPSGLLPTPPEAPPPNRSRADLSVYRL